MRTIAVAYFFFSSRRRHTRSYGDWSSDVCSSDLATTRQNRKETAVASLRSEPDITMFTRQFTNLANVSVPDHMRTKNVTRSEERRVGKECRYQMWRTH